MWRGVEFWPFPLTCFVAFKTLLHYRASVWCRSLQRLHYLKTKSNPDTNPNTYTSVLHWEPNHVSDAGAESDRQYYLSALRSIYRTPAHCVPVPTTSRSRSVHAPLDILTPRSSLRSTDWTLRPAAHSRYAQSGFSLAMLFCRISESCDVSKSYDLDEGKEWETTTIFRYRTHRPSLAVCSWKH